MNQYHIRARQRSASATPCRSCRTDTADSASRQLTAAQPNRKVRRAFSAHSPLADKAEGEPMIDSSDEKSVIIHG
jgi:hypothetical protein